MPDITRVQELIYELAIKDVMRTDVITVSPETSMAQIREILRQHRISGVPIMEGPQLVGIISTEDLIEALAKGEMASTAADKMARDPVTLLADEPVVLAVKQFERYGFGRFPVLDQRGRLVGIITRGDVIQGLLKRLEVEYHEEEVRKYRASHIFQDIVSDRTSMMLRYDIMAGDLEHAGEASSHIKRALSRLGASPLVIRRAAIASYEAEMNIILHTEEGGELLAEIQPGRLIIRAVDTGPGIPDVEKAMQPGYSTATEWIRELGFGAGMGLSNIKKCSDHMRLESPSGRWTSLEVIINLEPQTASESSPPVAKAQRQTAEALRLGSLFAN